MAGSELTMTVDDARVRDALARMVARSMDLKPAFEDIGASLKTSTQQRFEDKKSPEGNDWQDVSPAYALRKRKGGRRMPPRDPANILRSKGYLRDTITYLASRFDLEVGSNRTYAAIHQLGGSSGMKPGPAAIPARPYLGISAADENEIGLTLIDHLGGALA